MKKKFNKLGITVFQGDCREVMRAGTPGSIDAVICDPPYELGFMGKKWDGLGIAYDPNTWREAYRVLKPGGHLLAFGGSRTFHRIAVAIEDAGFELRDSIAWLYGCLTADVEVLTDKGWMSGVEVVKGDLVAQWDHTTGQISLAPVQQVFRAPWDGPMRVLRNADTDQVLTPNHRVYHRAVRRKMVDGKRRRWYEDDWQVVEASELSTWNGVQLPIAGEHDGPGVGGDDYAALLGWVWTEGGFDLSGTGVRIYQSSVNADKVAEIAELMDRLGAHKRYDRDRQYRGRSYTETTWFFSGELAERVRTDLPGKRPTYDLLWRMTSNEKRALLRAAMLGDGSGLGTKSEQFYQQYEDDLVWLQTLLSLIGRSGKVGMRPNRSGGAVYLRDRATTELQARHLRDATAHYTGEVWCVQVPAGAFVARRSGRVFITGNSGFPKSMDVSKALDKAAGHVRGSDYEPNNGNAVFGRGMGGGRTTTVDPPATDAAKQWQGWGTALKPAFEPIVVARKPLGEKTVAANVLAHGTGALNIDATRVVTTDKLGGGANTAMTRDTRQDGWARPWMDDHATRDAAAARSRQNTARAESLGRWPANVLLDGEMADELDAQTGVSVSRIGKPRGADPGEGWGMTHTGAEYADAGGASRFFPTFRYQAKAPAKERPKVDGVAHPTVKPLELMRWLCKLVTPPGGRILDPFAGSGTTLEAAYLEGFRAIGVEYEAEYIPLIVERLSKHP